MAYNRKYNPDALPAHTEPEQAAAMLSQKPRVSSRDDYPPSSSRIPPDDRYRSGGGPANARRTNSGGYGTYDDGRNPAPRRDAYARDDRAQRNDADNRRGGGYNNRYDERERDRDRGARAPPAPPGASGDRDRDGLWAMFRAVDRDGSGMLSEQELGSALVNGDYTQFDPHTVKMMIRMFDVDRSGTIDFEEFCGLWGFLSEWRKLFNRFDLDHSGHIDYKEFSSALVAFGYRLSPEYVSLLFDTYDTRGRGVLSFDLFVQSCISLKRMTDVFKRYDTDRDGYITLSFEQFLTGAQELFLLNSISPQTDRGVY